MPVFDEELIKVDVPPSTSLAIEAVPGVWVMVTVTVLDGTAGLVPTPTYAVLLKLPDGAALATVKGMVMVPRLGEYTSVVGL